MKFEDFKDRHFGETMICIGNGKGLKNIPIALLESYPSIGMNYITHWLPFLKLDYWLTLDKECLFAIRGDIPSFVPYRYLPILPANLPNVVPFILPEVRGIPYSKSYGSSYTTSLAAAAHLALIMGAKKVLIVGFDCTFPVGPLRPHLEGRSNLPHFYHAENVPLRYMSEWDYEMEQVAKLARVHYLSRLLNLSEPTDSLCLPWQNYREVWP